MVEQEVKYSLPNGYRWLTAKIIDTSQNIHANITINDENLFVSTGLFRCKEFIRFQGILEAPIPATSSYDIMYSLNEFSSITHRIADTNLYRIYVPYTFDKKRSLKIFYLTVALSLFFIAFLFFMYVNHPKLKTHYVVFDSNSVPHEVIIQPKLDGKITLKGVNDNFQNTLDANEFYKKGNFTVKIIRSDNKNDIIGLSLLFGLICFASYLSIRRRDKIRKLVKIKDYYRE
jgi:hypothetical protein